MPAEHPARDMQDTLYLDEPVRTRLVVPRRRADRARVAPARATRTYAPGDAAADAYLRDADPLHGAARAAGAHHLPGSRLPPRQPRPDAHADVPAGRGPGRRRARDDGRPEGHARRASCASSSDRRASEDRVPAELLPLHGAERRRVPAAIRRAVPQAGSRSSAAAWCTRRCSRRSATIRSAIRALPSAWASSAWRMLLFGVDDIRQFYENDMRFLEQFPQ